MKLIIKRIATGDNGTFGVVMYNDIPFALTLERQWLNNQRGISCIPAGKYICKRVNSPKFGNTFEITNVPDRSSILFHKGNLDDDSHGCVLVGEQFEPINGSPGIVASAHGYNEFMLITSNINQFELDILWC
jgi:hypothetical protein